MAPTQYATGPHSVEELTEALFELRRDRDLLLRHSQNSDLLLEALAALLQLDRVEDPFAQVFAALRRVFSYSHAMLLVAVEDGSNGAETQLECTVAEPAALAGRRWPMDAAFKRVLTGKVVATFSSESLRSGGGNDAGFGTDQSALYIPVRVHERRGLLALLRQADLPMFDRMHVTLGRRFSVLVSHALAMHYAVSSELEGQRLKADANRSRTNEQVARRDLELLKSVVNALPVGVALQDSDGRIMVVNVAAAMAMGRTPDQLAGQQPFDIAPGGQHDGLAERRRQAFLEHLASGQQQTRERIVETGAHEHVLLVTGTPVRISGEQLMLTTTLDITERKRSELELQRHAYHDALTGLPNRVMMQQIVDRALETAGDGELVALAFIDLDGFKQVNDYYSHSVGDELLRSVAQRISQTIRSTDALSRISGDEFLLLVNPLESEHSLPVLMNRVVDALRRSFHVEGHEVLISASVGASIYPLHGTTYEALRRCADSAMYRAKRERKGSVAYFDTSMNSALTARMELEQKLRSAIRDECFRAAYQPKIEVSTGRITGFEALVRWVDHDGTVHMPVEFIGMAAELGLLDQISAFVLDDAVHALPLLQQEHGPDVSMNINISARQICDVTFMEQLMTRFEDRKLARHLVLELTEDALVEAHRFQRQILPALRERGIRVSVDDFGTGFSSLSTLIDITADEVKVDRAFVTRIHERERSQSVLRAIESLCRALGITVVAEGVETEQELEYLVQHTTIDCVQGYYFSRPRFLPDLLARRRSKPGSLHHQPLLKVAGGDAA